MKNLHLQGNCTDHIWLMLDGEEPNVIGLRMDCGDSGTVYLSRSQAVFLVEELGLFLAKLKEWDASGKEREGEGMREPRLGDKDSQFIDLLEKQPKGPDKLIELLRAQLAASEAARFKLEERIIQSKKLYEMTLDNELSWMKKHEESKAARVKAEAACAEMRIQFDHIHEYWNGNHNDTAMSDALDHILDVCENAMKSDAGSCLLERLKAADELARQIGKLFHEQGEDFRLNSPEALDAYSAYESLKGGGE